MTRISYAGYRFPPVIIQQAVWLYARFSFSFRDVEDPLAERGIITSYETVRRWVNHFGSLIAAHLRRRRPFGAYAVNGFLGGLGLDHHRYAMAVIFPADIFNGEASRRAVDQLYTKASS